MPACDQLIVGGGETVVAATYTEHVTAIESFLKALMQSVTVNAKNMNDLLELATAYKKRDVKVADFVVQLQFWMADKVSRQMLRVEMVLLRSMFVEA